MGWDSFELDFTLVPPGDLQENMKKVPLLGHKTNSPNRCYSCSIKPALDINRHAWTCQYVTEWLSS